MSLELNIAICDDEKYYRELLHERICEYMERNEDVYCHIRMFKDGFDFCEEENNFKNFDIIFLDIEMKNKNGMDTAYEIRERNNEMDIVFITVASNYVYEGYRVQAERYILKEHMEKELTECLDFLLKKRRYDDKRMEFSFVGGNRSILLRELMYIESRSHKLRFVRISDSLYMYGRVDALEKKLSKYNFVRCHQSYLVNLGFIDKIRNYCIYLSEGTEIPVSRPRYSKVRDQFLKYKEI